MTSFSVTVFDDPVGLLSSRGNLSRAEQTRADILVAAEKEYVFRARDDLNLSDIAAAAGISSSSLVVYYFKSVSRLIRVSRDFRWVPINAYRQELMDRFSKRGWLSASCCFFALVEPIAWAAACAGTKSNVARSIYLHQRKLMLTEGAEANHGGRKVLEQIVDFIVNDRLVGSGLAPDTLAYRAELLSIGMPAHMAGVEKSIAQTDGVDLDSQMTLWRQAVEDQYSFACDLFEIAAPRSATELMQVSDDLRRDIGGNPEWAVVAHRAGVF